MSRKRGPLPAGFGTIWTAVAIDLVGFGIVLPILPLYTKQFGASVTTIGLLIASFSVAQLFAAPLLGRLSDRVGRRPVLIGSMVGTAVGSLLTGLAPGLWMLFLGRIIDGASGASVSVARAAVTDLAEPSQRPRLFGLLGAAFGLGFVAGPALGGVASLAGPRVPFILAALVSGANAAVAWRRLPETHPVGSISARTRSVGVARELRNRRVQILLGVGFLSTAAFSAFETTFALFGARRVGLHLASASAVFAFAGIMVALSSVGLVHPVVARLGASGSLRFGVILVAGGLAGLAVSSTWWTLIPSLALICAGQGLVTPTLTSAIVEHLADTSHGATLGVQHSVAGMARIAGPVAGGILFEVGGPSTPMAISALACVLAVVLLGLSRAGHEPPELLGQREPTGGVSSSPVPVSPRFRSVPGRREGSARTR